MSEPGFAGLMDEQDFYNCYVQEEKINSVIPI